MMFVNADAPGNNAGAGTSHTENAGIIITQTFGKTNIFIALALLQRNHFICHLVGYFTAFRHSIADINAAFAVRLNHNAE